MTTNRSDISTSVDGVDIFVISQPDASFINLGTLSTNGDVSRPISITADGVTVDNKGAISTSGDGSTGIIVGDPYGARYSNVTVTNHGTIMTAGGTLANDPDPPIFASGIDLFGDHNKGVNYGSITNVDGDNVGMNSVGSYSTLLNFGQIDSTLAGMVIDQYSGDEVHSSAINYGSIVTHWDGSWGMIALVGDNILKNYGTIQVEGFASFGMSLEGDRNHGENYGTIVATGEADRGVLLNGVGLSFANYGTIRTTGADSIGARFSGENLAGTDGGIFTNYGRIISAGRSVSGVDSNDHFVNRGVLIGDATLGAGDDFYVAGKGGSLSGTLVLGDGNDCIILEKGGGNLMVADFVAGAGTDDVIDLSGLSYHSFSEVMAHATQLGSDVVLNLGPRDQVVLQGVALEALVPDDFVLSVSAHSHASLWEHDLLGMI